MGDRPTLLTPPEIAELLRAAATTLCAELSALPAPVLSWHPVPEEWCVKEALGHLIEAERRGFAGRIRLMLEADEPTFITWDPPAVAGERRDCARDAAELLAEFTALREASVALVAGLGEADRRRGGHHPEVGYVQIDDVLHEWVHHDRNHVKQMFANVQAFVWPAMGNTRRFSEP